MKVTHPSSLDTSQIEKASQTKEKSNARAKEASTEAPKNLSSASSVEISEEAQLRNQATELANSADIRDAEKLTRLKSQIQEGTYQIDSASVAEKLIEEHLFTNFGKNSL